MESWVQQAVAASARMGESMQHPCGVSDCGKRQEDEPVTWETLVSPR